MKKQRRDPWQGLRSRLVARRHSLGLTQEQLATLVFRGRPTVSQWESGAQSPPAETLLDWIAALGLRVLLAPAQGSRGDVSVGSSGDTRTVDVEIGGFGFPLDYDDAETLRDMITDALEHIDECDRNNHAARETTEISNAWNLYLHHALNRRSE